MIKIKIKEENKLLIVLGLIYFTYGAWINYRQLWLKSYSFDTIQISRLLSVAVICSAIIIFFITFFSTKVNLKSLNILVLTLRSLAFLGLCMFSSNYLIKVFMLLSIMCENIFSLSIYPLISLVNKSNKVYKKHILISFYTKDIAIILCGLLLGYTLGSFVFNYNTCLSIALILNTLALVVLLTFNDKHVTLKKKEKSLLSSFKVFFKSKHVNSYLVAQFISELSYSSLFGILMLLLTQYLEISVVNASLLIIVCNIIGSIICSILNKYSDKFSFTLSSFIKFGIRFIFLLLAVIINKTSIYLLAIIIYAITTRLLDDQINGKFIRSIEDNERFLFGNIRYFILCISSSIALFLAGTLVEANIRYLFMFSMISCFIALNIYMFVVGKKSLK